MDGDLDEDELHPPTRLCGSDFHPRNYPRDDGDEGDGGRRWPSTRGILNKVSNWIDGRGRSRDHQARRDHNREWHREGPSRGPYRAQRDLSNPPPPGKR
jgi:hypothetical protein